MGRWAMRSGNAGVDRVHEVYDASYRRLVGQLTGVTGDRLLPGPELVVDAIDAGFEFRARRRLQRASGDEPGDAAFERHQHIEE